MAALVAAAVYVLKLSVDRGDISQDFVNEAEGQVPFDSG
jgi:hypothetical protein